MRSGILQLLGGRYMLTYHAVFNLHTPVNATRLSSLDEIISQSVVWGNWKDGQLLDTAGIIVLPAQASI